MNRPRHLKVRQFEGRAFGHDAVLVRQAGDGTWSDTGRFVPTATERVAVRVATSPGGIVHDAGDVGIRIEGVRRFWLATKTSATASARVGDIIEYGGDNWKVMQVGEWDDLQYNVTAERMDRR